MDTHIILLHGLGCSTWTLRPLKEYLLYQGHKNVSCLEYPADVMNFDETMEYVDTHLVDIVGKDKPIIVVGQSMGGVVANNLHKKGWNIQKSITIGSPLHGANLLNQLESILPTFVTTALYKKPYDFLKNKDKDDIPPHPYSTISMGWFCSNFDGCVYKNETMLEEENHTHLAFTDHRTIFASPRLWTLVNRLVQETC